MTPPPAPKPKRRPPPSLFALGRDSLPAQVTANGFTWNFSKLFKHDFFAATALYHRADNPSELAVLKVQRTYHFFGLPAQWLGVLVARHEIRLYQKLQGIRGIPAFLGEVGPTGFLHAFIPGVDLHSKLPLTPVFFADLEKLFADIHSLHIAYVDSNKRENILYGEDGRPWLIDFQISFECRHGPRDNPLARWLLKKFQTADLYHFYKHKTRLLPSACSPEDFQRAEKRGLLHKIHRVIAQPLIRIRRKFLSRYDLAQTK
jgi:hypothetical protein